MSSRGFLSRYSDSLYLTFLFFIGFIGWIITAVIVSFFFFFSDLETLFLGLLVAYMIMIFGGFGAFLWAVSRSKYFLCKLGYFQSFSESFKLIIQLSLIQLLIFLILLLLIDDFLVLFIVITFTFSILFPVSALFYIMEWILENKDNPRLSRNYNARYLKPMESRQRLKAAPQYTQTPLGEQSVLQQIDSTPQEKPIRTENDLPHVFCNDCGKQNRVKSLEQYCVECGSSLDNSKFSYLFENTDDL